MNASRHFRVTMVMEDSVIIYVGVQTYIQCERSTIQRIMNWDMHALLRAVESEEKANLQPASCCCQADLQRCP